MDSDLEAIRMKRLAELSQQGVKRKGEDLWILLTWFYIYSVVLIDS